MQAAEKVCINTPGRSVCWCISQGMCFSLLFVPKKKRKLSESLIPCSSKNKGSVALRGSSCWLEKRMILQILTKIVSPWRLKGAVMECKWVGQAAARGQDPSERSYSERGFTQLTGRQKHWLERNNNLWIARFSTFISQPRTRQVQ